MRTPEVTINKFNKLDAMSIKILVDNFGIGYSCLKLLKDIAPVCFKYL